MPTSTPRLGLLMPIDGGDDDAWGPMLNQNAQTLDDVIATQAALGDYLPLPGGTMRGRLLLASQEPEDPLEAASKYYVENHVIDGGNF